MQAIVRPAIAGRKNDNLNCATPEPKYACRMSSQFLAFVWAKELLDIPGARCEYVHVRSAAAVLAADGPVHIQQFFAATRVYQHSARVFKR